MYAAALQMASGAAATDSLLSLAWLTDDFEQPEILASISSRQGAVDTEVRSDVKPAGSRAKTSKRNPLSLAPLHTQLGSTKSTGRIGWPGIEDLSFADLSPTIEHFDNEMMGLWPLKSIIAL